MAMKPDPEHVKDVKERLRLVHRINNPMAVFKMAEDALQVIEAYEEREAADKTRRARSQKQSAD